MLNRSGQDNSSCSQEEIDLFELLRVFIRRIKIFFLVSISIFAIGFIWSRFIPNICRVSISIFPPIGNERLIGVNDSKYFEKIKSLINSQVFNEELKKRSSSDFNNTSIEFKAEIPEKSNILRINVDLEERKKELGVLMLGNLGSLISGSYARNIEINTANIISQINQNEQVIQNYKEKIRNLPEQIKEIMVRKDKLIAVFAATKCQENNSRYIDMLNKELSKLSLRSDNLTFELSEAISKTSELQTKIYELTMSKDFISSALIISGLRTSFSPLNSRKNRIVSLSLNLALFLGVCAGFLQEYWVLKSKHA